jgi:hypothetical protein
MIKLINIIKEIVKETIFSGKRVWDHIVLTTPEEDDIPWGFKDKIRSRKFKVVSNFNIESLLKTDPDFREYYESGEIRYNNQDENANIENEIVVVDGELLDGYSRVSTLLRDNKKYTNAFVAI